jgi:hypothetical protein
MKDRLDLFAEWADSASEWCEMACGCIPDKVPVAMWLEWYRTRLRPEVAGAMAAKLISR